MRIVPACLLPALLCLATPPSDTAQADFVCLADRLTASPAPSGPSPGDGPGDDGSLIDALVVYTPGARVAAGGRAAMLDQIDGHVAFTNTTYLASGVAQRMRLVLADEVAYTSTGNILTDVDRLKTPGDGWLDGVHAIRDAVAADLTLLVVDAASAGTAYQMQSLTTAFASCAFGVIDVNVEGRVFAHEAGHIMGLGHDNVGGASAVFCYAFGHKTSGAEVFRTVMSNPPGTKIDLFSNPDLDVDGQPLGIDGSGCPPGAADAARALDDTALTVANFRVSLDGGNALLDAGGGLAGAAGVPQLSASTTLVPGFAGSILLDDAAASAPAALFIGTNSTPVPFKGGTLIAFPVLASLPLSTSLAGDVLLSWSAWPALPPGTPLTLQAAVADAGAPAGVALSTALSGTTR